MPKANDLEIFEDDNGQLGDASMHPLKKAFDDNNCEDEFIEARPIGKNLSEECGDILKSISMYSFNGGGSGDQKKCNCDPTGSKSTVCDEYTGQCQCKKNVAGRRCSRCAPAFYGFGQDGCTGKIHF